MLRLEAGRNPHDKALIELVGELSTRSELFRQRWASHDVRFHRSGQKRLRHPVVGQLDLDFEAMELPSEPGLPAQRLHRAGRHADRRRPQAARLLGGLGGEPRHRSKGHRVASTNDHLCLTPACAGVLCSGLALVVRRDQAGDSRRLRLAALRPQGRTPRSCARGVYGCERQASAPTPGPTATSTSPPADPAEPGRRACHERAPSSDEQANGRYRSPRSRPPTRCRPQSGQESTDSSERRKQRDGEHACNQVVRSPMTMRTPPPARSSPL